MPTPRWRRPPPACGIPFVQSTMSNDTVEDVARVPGLRHWWQLYVFGGDEVWQELLRRVEAAGCEALVLTTNAQIFGNREWSTRTPRDARRGHRWPRCSRPCCIRAGWPSTLLDARHAGVPQRDRLRARRTSAASSPARSGSARTSRRRCPGAPLTGSASAGSKPLLLKGILHPDDVRRALDAGVDGVVLSSHGGRQLDGCVAGLDLLPAARAIAGDRMALYTSGGVRRGTDLLKACALGADAVWAGRAPLVRRVRRGRPGRAARAGDPAGRGIRCARTCRRHVRGRPSAGPARACRPLDRRRPAIVRQPPPPATRDRWGALPLNADGGDDRPQRHLAALGTAHP